jgi:hypothetical protein
MTFEVEPTALRTGAVKVGDAARVAEAAGRYVTQHGSFSFHERGLIGFLAPGHRHLMSDLQQVLTQLGHLGDASRTALNQIADRYEHTDLNTEANLDATYPAVRRAHPD